MQTRASSSNRFMSAVCVVASLAATNTGFATPNPPAPVDSTPIILPADPSLCPFPIRIVQNGKAKSITLPGNRSIFTSPGLVVEITNLTDESKSYSQGVTGSFHQSIDSVTGYIVTKTTGRSLLGDPTTGLVLVNGNYRFIFDGNGTLVEPLNGQGTMVSACQLVS